MSTDQMVLHVTMKGNVLARRLILSGTSVIDVILDTMGQSQTVKVGLTVNNIS